MLVPPDDEVTLIGDHVLNREQQRLPVPASFPTAAIARPAAAAGVVTPSGVREVLNDAISIYFADATLASAFVARWCVGFKVETAGGAFQAREDEPAPRVGAGLHRTL
jgi:hypothetical protein